MVKGMERTQNIQKSRETLSDDNATPLLASKEKKLVPKSVWLNQHPDTKVSLKLSPTETNVAGKKVSVTIAIAFIAEASLVAA